MEIGAVHTRAPSSQTRRRRCEACRSAASSRQSAGNFCVATCGPAKISRRWSPGAMATGGDWLSPRPHSSRAKRSAPAGVICMSRRFPCPWVPEPRIGWPRCGRAIGRLKAEAPDAGLRPPGGRPGIRRQAPGRADPAGKGGIEAGGILAEKDPVRRGIVELGLLVNDRLPGKTHQRPRLQLLDILGAPMAEMRAEERRIEGAEVGFDGVRTAQRDGNQAGAVVAVAPVRDHNLHQALGMLDRIEDIGGVGDPRGQEGVGSSGGPPARR